MWATNETPLSQTFTITLRSFLDFMCYVYNNNNNNNNNNIRIILIIASPSQGFYK